MIRDGDRKKLLVLDCGSKLFNQLCSQLDQQNIPYLCRSLSPIRYCDQINAPRIRTVSEFVNIDFNGIVLSGSSRYNPNLAGAPYLPVGVLDFIYQHRIPILGLCYGMQMLATTFGGCVQKNPQTDYNEFVHNCKVLNESPLFQGLPKAFPVFLFHKHRVEQIPPGFQLIAQGWRNNANEMISPHIGIQYLSIDNRFQIFGLQFHPESENTPKEVRDAIFKNFWALCN
jgi:GMP synthase (glutamine-hydrolysing)